MICGIVMKRIGFIEEYNSEFNGAIVGIPMGWNAIQTMAELEERSRGLQFPTARSRLCKILMKRVRLHLP